MAERADARSAEIEATETIGTDTEDAETAFASYAVWLKDTCDGNFVTAIHQAASLPLGEPPTPELVAARARLLAYQPLPIIAQRGPNDYQIIAADLGQVNVVRPPTVERFAVSFILDSPGSQISTGVSHATQQAVVESLGFDDQRNRAAYTTTDVGVFEALLPDNATDANLGHIVRTTQLRDELHALNMAHVIYPDVTIGERGGGPITVEPWHYPITNRFLDTMVANRTFAGNKLLSQTDLDKIPYLMQFHNRRGDANKPAIGPSTMASGLVKG